MTRLRATIESSLRPAISRGVLLLALCVLSLGAKWKEAPVMKGAVPFITGDGNGGFVVSYADGKEFRFARVAANGAWSQSRVIAKDDALLVNRADFPSIIANGNTMIATWSTKNGGHGTIVHLAQSNDGGATWSKARTPHSGEVAPFGFVSLLPNGEAVWLDGRILPGGVEGAGDMQLRANDALLDARVCDCCQTAMAMTSDGPIVAYRDRSDAEVRDISIVRRTASGWSKPKALHADGWTLKGCPVNGPQLDARGRRVVAVWFTAANNEPRVFAAFSNDAGASFGAPIRIDLGKTTGRADVVMRADGSAVVTWIENGALTARSVDGHGKLGDPLRIANALGFPRLAISKENVAVAWAAEDGVHVSMFER